MKKKDKNSSGSKNEWLQFLHLGWLFTATMTVFLFGGLKLDQVYHKAPVFLLAGTFFGFIACGYFLIRLIKKLDE